jgi:hypothetical protein
MLIVAIFLLIQKEDNMKKIKISKLGLCDQIVLENFKNLITTNVDGITSLVPIIWGSDEKAAAWANKPLFNNCDSLMLPFLNIYNYKINKIYVNTKLNPETMSPITDGTNGFEVFYRLTGWFKEDAYQVVEQIMFKFAPNLALWSPKGDRRPGNLHLDSICNNMEDEQRVIKYRFDLRGVFCSETLGEIINEDL